MTNEIKEILNKWKCYIELTKKFTTNEYEMLRVEDIDKILDCITNLQEKYDKSLELLSDFNVPCECVDCKIKIPDEYCEKNCNNDYKKCWNKYIEISLRGDE